MKGIIRFSTAMPSCPGDGGQGERRHPQGELISLAETCEWVPEHPARNLREAMQCTSSVTWSRRLSRSAAATPKAFLGQNLEPYYQRDKAAGLVTYDDAVFMFENLAIKLNEISYYYGEAVAKQTRRPGTEHHPRWLYRGRWRCDAEMDYVILDACAYLALPQPRCPVQSPRIRRQADREVLRCDRHRPGHAPVPERGGDVQAGPAPLGLHRTMATSRWAKPGAPASAPVWELHPLRDRPSGGSQPNLARSSS